ncbi:inorganic anion transporter, SulP family [Oesophagostomum dentatum]|uniref:Inorganic anion transporter, SulP family n=1 Tax=Oesophagostomum dentatum TaxID=61180 RepID=A0A0B1SKR5_OESDE|nr:inorganic anion transporter, SulP family [Oesophagostomum dentatum]
MTFLYTGKEYLSPYLAKKFKLNLPIPYELILVAVTAALSYLLGWHDKNSVQIVGNVPAGLPEPELPVLGILKDCLLQSIGIAIVIIAVHISMAKMLGKKMNYPVDDSQELYAIGLTSILGGFFPVYPVSTALGRTMVNVKSGSKTLLSTVFSCALLMAIILWLGPLLRDLPKCVLASIITVALKSMFMKYGELKRIYPVSKIDFVSSLKMVLFLPKCSIHA